MAFYDPGEWQIGRLSLDGFSGASSEGTARRANSFDNLERLAAIPDNCIMLFNPDLDRDVLVELDKGLTPDQKRQIVESTVKAEKPFLQQIRERWDRVGLTHMLQTVEVRLKDLTVEADVSVGERSLPSVKNSCLDVFEKALTLTRLKHSSTTRLKLLDGINAVLKPGEVTLLLGPPGSGKSTLMKAAAGYYRHKSRTKPKNFHVTGEVLYNGYNFDEFSVERSCAYVSQVDDHIAWLTVRETLEFARMCTGADQEAQLLQALLEKEAQEKLDPDPALDAFTKTMLSGSKKHDVAVDMMLNGFGLDVCADTVVGSAMLRGVSGGQKKRVTTCEMAISRRKVLLLDEISTGLDSATTFQIMQRVLTFAHSLNVTVMVSLLQPPPETYSLFDNIMFLSEGALLYYGPREQALPVFEGKGFRCPPRTAHADFLQEVTSMKDQQHYWSGDAAEYSFVPANEFVAAFKSSGAGEAQQALLESTPDREAGKDSLWFKKYSTSGWRSLAANRWRQHRLFERQRFVYVFRFIQIAFLALVSSFLFFRTQLEITTSYGVQLTGFLFYTLTNMFFNSLAEMAMTVEVLPVTFKQRDAGFYPGWAMAIPRTMFSIPFSVFIGIVWSVISYYLVGLAPQADRFFVFMLYCVLTHITAGSLFRLLASIGRTMVVVNSIGIFVLLVIILSSGATLAYSSFWEWCYWGYWSSPLNYAYRGMMSNEFSAPRWQTQAPGAAPGVTIGDEVLMSRGLSTDDVWRWIGIGALIAMFLGMTLLQALVMSTIPPIQPSPPSMTHEGLIDLEIRRTGHSTVVAPTSKSKSKGKGKSSGTAKGEGGVAAGEKDVELGTVSPVLSVDEKGEAIEQKGSSAIPFTPMAMSFKEISYFVPTPPAMAKEDKAASAELQLLHEISGVFSPGALTALMGASGAGKTTLMDVLAGRKTGGRTTGDVRVGGYSKQQDTFARISGYVEQTDVHSPQVTVAESLIFSARMRLDGGVDDNTMRQFVSEISDLVELTPLANALVGMPGESGLSVEQRKRLTIAVELVANPSIVFMDEPTSGLDARAAAIVMRTVKNIVNTQRTVVCTIHQPNLQIFEAFDELLLLKRGGYTIFFGALGAQCSQLISYLEGIPGVDPCPKMANPANWMLDATNSVMEGKLGVDFAEIFKNSDLQQKALAAVDSAACPAPGSSDLHFPTRYAASFAVQQRMLLWRFWHIYWRAPLYNLLRVVVTVFIGLLMGMFYWDLGGDTSSFVGVQNIMGGLYVTLMFLGTYNSTTVQPMVSVERSVLYREQAGGMYTLLPWVMAQAVVELPYISAQSVLYSLITYFMIGFDHDAGKFFWFLLYLWLTLLFFTQFGVMAIAMSPNQQFASIWSSMFLAIWNLFSGFIIPQPGMPPWLSWCYYLNPLAWGLYGINVSQLGDSQDPINVGTSSNPSYVTVSQFLNDHFGFEYSFRIWSALILSAFIAVTYIGTAAALKFLNFQNR